MEEWRNIPVFNGKYQVSINEAIRQNPNLKLSHSKISNCCTGKRNKHKGFIWKYA